VKEWIVGLFKMLLAVLALVIIGMVLSRDADAAGDVLRSAAMLEVNEESVTDNARKGGV
jgi:hypothetical protein